MKTKIFSILAIAIISFSAYAQIPTTGLVGHYDFNNGALTDNINNVSFTKAGSASTNITDRFGATNQAIMLNGDDLTRPDIDFNLSNSSPFLTQSISFWMKTGNNDANKRIIYSDNDQSSFADTSFDGMSVHLKDGQISAAFRDNIHSGNYFTHSTIVGDNTWHHVVVQASVTKTFGTRRIITHIYIDAVKEGGTALVTGGMGNTDPNHVGNLSFSRLKATSLSNSQKYLDGLDEVLFYNRLLTDAEVVLISTPVACTVNIPDANFKAYLVGNSLINTNGDTEIQCSEATAFTGTITVYNLGISDLTGIEAFTALTQLNCVTNQLTSLDLSANTALTSIDCRDNQLMSLDLPASIALTELKCGDNQITSLDVSANTALTDLSGHSNQLTSLDVSSNTALIDLDFDGSPITSIDVSANTALVSLAISRTQLTSIDVSTNTALEYFYATDCQLTSLDLSAQPNLELLWCNENQLTSLNIANGNNANMTSFYATDNTALTCIEVDAAIVGTSPTDWYKDAGATYSASCTTCTVNIPDANFKAYLLGNTAINTNGDSEIQCSEASAFTGQIYIVNQNLSNLIGIEAFTALTALWISDNQLTSLDVSANTALTQLICLNNQLTSIDVSANTALTFLHVYNNQLTSLDVSANTALLGLRCNNNQITSLDISANTALTGLSAHYNQLTSIDVSANTALTGLSLSNNQLTSIDVSANIALTELWSDNNPLIGLDISTNTNLMYLYCNSNQLTSLDLSAHLNLEELNCSDNQLTSLNVANGNNANMYYLDTINNAALSCIEVDAATVGTSPTGWTKDAVATYSANCTTCTVNIPDANFKTYLVANTAINTNGDTEIQCSEATAFTGEINIQSANITDMTGLEAFTALTSLKCNNNLLTTLDLSGNTALTALYCGANQLTALDVSVNTSLITLSAFLNSITTIDVSSNTALEFLSLGYNSIASIDVSSNLAMKEFYINNNNISAVDITNLSNLEILLGTDNQISALDVTNNTMLTTLEVGNNQISTLDLTNNTQLSVLECYANQLTALDVSNNLLLTELICGFNQIPSLDLSAHAVLNFIACQSNNMTSLNVANGNNSNIVNVRFRVNTNPNLTCITVDDVAYSDANWANIDLTTSFSINCNAQDNTAPTAVCQNITVQLDSTGNVTITPAQIDGGSTDDVAIASIVVSQTSFDCSSVGSNTVTITVTDTSGNTDTCTATITVEDSETPVITNATTITANTDTASCNAVVAYTQIGVTDNCTGTLSFDIPSGSTFAIGTTTVTATATDASNNTSTATFDVVVEDNEAPLITNAATITVNTDTASCDAVVAYTQIGVTDNCTATLSFDIPSGSTFSLGTTTVTATATDASNNTSTATFDVVVEDNEAPVISCPTDEVVMVPQGDTYTLPDYITNGSITATDNCNVTITQTPVAGTQVAVGMQTVSFQATDGTNIVTCSFELTVDEILGVNTVSLQKAVFMYPNPATHTVNIESLFKIEQLVIYSVTGQKVMTSSAEILNIQDLASGVYFVSIKTVEGTIVKRLIKK